MKITDVRIRKVPGEGRLRGVASVTLDDEFVVHDIKIIEGEKGLFIAMPSKKNGENEFRDIAHPIKAEIREYFQSEILLAFEKAMAESEE
ncbi:MAG: septation regulator SpoVG [Lachnospiraceae bacterium]|nr:septation regulator SpoVG [Lachnospiraceae bacterium]